MSLQRKNTRSEGCSGTSDKKDREPEHCKILYILLSNHIGVFSVKYLIQHLSWFKKYFDKTHDKITSQFNF